MPQPTNGNTRSSATSSVLAEVIQKLPPLPGSTHELLALNVKDPALPEKVRSVVERDPALASHVIRVANSAAFRGQGEITAIGPAIHRIGASLVVGNALQSAVHRVFDPYGGMGRRLGQLAVIEANLMSALAACWKAQPAIPSEVAYAHGLLHDLGHLVMALRLGKAFEDFHHRGYPAAEVAQRETEAFGFDHQQAGRLLANHWGLPDELTVVVASHHFPRELRQGQLDSTTAIVDMLAVADRLSRLIADHVDRSTKAEGVIADWLLKNDSKSVLQPSSASADEVLAAVPLALAGVERDRRMSGGDARTPS
jgi:HD-like signal output (HDOD) protein